MKLSLFQVILLAFFGFAALIGLFVFATYTNKGGSNAIGPVVIWGTLPREDIESTITQATTVNTAVKNVSYLQKNPSTLATDLAAAIATGNGPDLVLASQEELFALAKFIAPVSSNSPATIDFATTYVDGASIFSTTGGYYGLPFLVDPLILFSNRSILSSSGIAQAPATWEALTGLVPAVATYTPTRQITRGLIALGTYSNVHNARAILSSLFLQTGTPISSVSPSGIIRADLGVAAQGDVPAGPAVVGFYTQFADPSKVSYTWNASLPDSQHAFLVGDLALYLGYVSEVRYFRVANPNLNFTLTPLPQPATASLKSAYGLIYAFMIPRGAKNPDGAYQAAALFAAPALQTIAAKATGLAPANLGAFWTQSTPAATVAYGEALYTRGWLSPAPFDTDAVFSGMIGNVISGRSTLETALISAESSLSAFLQQ